MRADGARLAIVLEGATASRYFAEAVPLLVDAGLDVRVFSCRGSGSLADAVRPAGVRLEAIGAHGVAMYPAAARRLRSALRAFGPTVVAAHEPIAGALAAAALRPEPAKLAFHRHHLVTGAAQRRMSRYASGRAAVTVAISGAVADASVREGVDPSRVTVAENGVTGLVADPTAVASLRHGLRIAPGDATVVLVARARPEKGHAVLFAAAAVVAPRIGRPLHVVVVGDGPHLDEVRRAADTAWPATVHIVGRHDDIGPWMALGDVVAVPSTIEPFGLTAIEAMSLGLPLVASRVGGLADIVDDGASGILVPPADPVALAGALRRLLDDPGEAMRVGHGGYRRWHAHFTMERMVERWLTVYNGIRSSRLD